MINTAEARGLKQRRPRPLKPVDPAIATRSLRFSYGDVEAVSDVSLKVNPGEIYGFLGPNGAGKTTLVRMLCTLLRPVAGVAAVAGFDVVKQAKEVRLNIGVALQDVALDAKQTGRQLLTLQARLYGLRRRDIDRRLTEVLDLIDLGDAIDRKISTYSGGMRRRLDLAAALVHQPSVLFLDEPTTGLDPMSRKAMWDEIRQMNEAHHMTIFLTTQYLEEADQLAERIGIINGGRMVAEGTPEELKQTIGFDVITVDLGDRARRARAVRAVDAIAGVVSADGEGGALRLECRDGAAVVNEVAVSLDRAGVPVRTLSLRRPSLDDVFFKLTGDTFFGGDEDGGASE